MKTDAHAPSDKRTFTAQLASTGQSFEVQAHETVLAAGLRQNIALPHACKVGGCGRCMVRLLKGQVRYEEFPYVLARSEAEQGYALSCKAIACSDLTLLVQTPGQAG
mgnify:FL=1